jgi:hypothetical protein
VNVQKPTAISVVLALRQADSRAAVLITKVSMAFLLVIAMHACSSEAPDTTPPARVTNLQVEAFTETTAVLVWTAPGDDGDRGRAVEYDLRESIGAPASDWVVADTAEAVLPSPSDAGATERTSVQGLTPAAVAYFALRTADANGNWSAFSNVALVEPGDPRPPARVTDLTALDPAPHAVTLVFTAPGDDSLSGTAAASEVRFAASPITEATWESAQLVPVASAPAPCGSPEHVRVTGLTPESIVHVAMRARDDASRWSAVSNDVEVTLPPDTISPGAINDLTVVETGIRTATLSWTAPGNDEAESKVDSYEIRYAESRITDEAAWTAATPATVLLTIVEPETEQIVLLTALPAPKTLWFAVRATDLAGQKAGLSNGVSASISRDTLTWMIRVDGTGDAPTVQAGIDSSVSGDTVLVMPGRYYENLNYNGKEIVLRSAEGPETTILDGSHKRESVVIIRSGEGHGTVLEGFTITGGVGNLPEGASSDLYRQGGGVLAVFCQPTIRGNIIAGNSAGYGGGILTAGSLWSPRIEGNTIRNNRAATNGGGIGVESSGVIESNLIEGNSNDAGDGGGIWVYNPGYVVDVVFRGNRIIGNEAADHGGGIYAVVTVPAAHSEIAGNVIAGNRALGHAHVEFSGGGIWLYGGNHWVHHNTIVGNDARGYPDPSWGGGGIAVLSSGTKLIENNIIAYSTYGGGIRCESIATFELRNNLAWSNVGGDGNGSCADWTSANGNLAADPLFCDQPGGDYSLAARSPALTHPAGPIGAFPTAGCGAMESKPLTWNRISTLYQ